MIDKIFDVDKTEKQATFCFPKL